MKSYVTLYRWKRQSGSYRKFNYNSNVLLTNIANVSNSAPGINIFLNSNAEIIEPEFEVAPKFPTIDFTLKIDVEEIFPGRSSYDGGVYNADYIRYRCEDDSGSSVLYYYFVQGVSRRASRTLEYTLKLDVLNTFNPGLPITYPQSEFNIKITNTLFDDDTLVLREHRDRFSRVNGNTLRVIDKVDEGFSLPVFVTKRSIYPSSFSKCYVVYKTSDDLTPDNLNNPVSCSIVYENGIPGRRGTTRANYELDGGGDAIVLYLWANPNLGKNPTFTFGNLTNTIDITLANIEDDTECLAFYLAGGQTLAMFKLKGIGNSSRTLEIVGSQQFDLGLTGDIYLYSSEHLVCSTPSIPSHNFEDTAFYTALEKVQYSDLIFYNATTDLPLLSQFKMVDRFDARNMKIVASSYALGELTGGVSGGYYPGVNYSIDTMTGFITPNDFSNVEFISDVGSIDLLEVLESDDYPSSKSSNFTLLRNDNFESKQFNSAYFQDSIVYDNNTLTLKYERMDRHYEGASYTLPSELPIHITYRLSNCISSKGAFGISSIKLGSPSPTWTFLGTSGSNLTIDYNALETFPCVMLAVRNNEVPIYSSDYVNYIRTGYNFDVKKAQRETTVEAITGSLGIASNTINAFNLASSQTLYGSLFSTASTITNLINNSIKRDESIQRTLTTEANKSINVEGSDDIDLFEWYSQNKLWRIVSEPSPITKQYMLDLFHYFGYATNERKVPDVMTRANFNYLQAVVTFRNEGLFDADILEEMKKKFSEGVVYLHGYRVNGEWNFDFDGTTANMEIWNCEE